MSPVARVDAELVRRGLARSRGQAGELIRAGKVRVDGGPALKPAQPVDPETSIEVEPTADRHDVGRGAGKLRAALVDLVLPSGAGVQVASRRAVDVGASTGGFTQVLVELGATSVLALDVGHGQLAPAVAAHPRVHELSGTNVRDVTADDLGGRFDLVVADLSFISLTVAMPHLADLVGDDGDLVALVKPQFEVGRERLGGDGVVRSEQQRQEAVEAVSRSAEAHGLAVRNVVPSRLIGASGNVEYFLWASR